MTKVIKSEPEYKDMLSEIHSLIARDPDSGTPEGDRLELLALLVQDYENRKFGALTPDPIDAIQFRMEQQNLTQKDLEPYIGSRSKVSEVLGRKRPLTLGMVRALHRGLGIPAKSLLQHRSPSEIEETGIQWDHFPIREMIERGWIKEPVFDIRDQAEDLLRPFLSVLGSEKQVLALYRKTETIRSARSMDPYALIAWTARIANRVRDDKDLPDYNPHAIDMDFMRRLAQLSTSRRGPRLSQDDLRQSGIPLVVEPHLPRTYLDGAAIMTPSGRPVIGLTLRHDRIDNFWFCLMHELAHVVLHLKEPTRVVQFYDDLDVGDLGDIRERQADQLAEEALIPQQIWEKSPASRLRSAPAVLDLADEIRIHPAIVAGRIRRKYKSYRVLSQFVGHGQVRRLFTEIDSESYS